MAMADKPDSEDRFNSDPLQPWEIRAIRKMLRDEERVKWFWSSLRLWFYYIGAAVAGVYAFQDQMSKMIDSMAKLIKKVFQ